MKGFNSEEHFNDCEIHVEDRVFKVSILIPPFNNPLSFQTSKFLLSVHSDVLKACFQPHTREGQTGILRIQEATPDIVEAMLRYFYTGTVENLSDVACELYVLADRFGVNRLMVSV
jgi:speckle-type POZ protein